MVAAVRKILIFLVVLIAVLVAIGALLVFTVPSRSADVHALIAEVPASAEAFAIIPRAAAFDAKLQANPVTRSAIAKWSASHPLPSPWMIGNADLIAWRSADQIHYLVRTDTFRAFLIRMVSSKVQINVTGEPPMDLRRSLRSRRDCRPATRWSCSARRHAALIRRSDDRQRPQFR